MEALKIVFHLDLQKAKKKPIKKVSPKDLGVDTTARIEIVSVNDPPVRQAGAILPDVDALVAKLKEGGHVKWFPSFYKECRFFWFGLQFSFVLLANIVHAFFRIKFSEFSIDVWLFNVVSPSETLNVEYRDDCFNKLCGKFWSVFIESIYGRLCISWIFWRKSPFVICFLNAFTPRCEWVRCALIGSVMFYPWFEKTCLTKEDSFA